MAVLVSDVEYWMTVLPNDLDNHHCCNHAVVQFWESASDKAYWTSEGHSASDNFGIMFQESLKGMGMYTGVFVFSLLASKMYTIKHCWY